MMVGLPPFYSEETNQLFEKIIKNTAKFPKTMSEEAKDLISRFLEKDPTKRLGYAETEKIKAHPWFNGIDWNKLLDKKIESPCVPKLKSETDVSNFA